MVVRVESGRRSLWLVAVLSTIACDNDPAGGGRRGTAGDGPANLGDAAAGDTYELPGDDAGCVAIAMSPFTGEAFADSDECAGVPQNQVLRGAEVGNHSDAYCDSLQACCSGCGCPGGQGAPGGAMILYVFGAASGCSATASIDTVWDCGARIEVDYKFEGTGACALMMNAWTSVAVAQSTVPVEFNLHP